MGERFQRASFYIGSAILERVRDLAFAERTTISGALNALLGAGLVTKELERGAPIPRRTGPLPMGRPPGAAD